MNCGNCHGSFDKGREPLLLPACGHTLCRGCLGRFICHSGFLCPFCREKQPKMEISSFHPNHALLQVIAAVKEENGRNVKKKPGNGRGNGDDESSSSSSSKEAVCVEHGNTRLAYWCVPCGVAACGECVVEKHSAGSLTGRRRHQPQRIETALLETRDALQNLVFEVTLSMDHAEEKRTAMTKTSPIVMGIKALQEGVGSVLGKMRIVASLLACQIKESESEDAGLVKLRQQWDELICKVPLASSSPAANLIELRALLDLLKEIGEFRDGPVVRAIKNTEAEEDQAEQEAFINAAINLTAALNNHAASLCKQVALRSGEGHSLEVVGGGGLVGRLTWNHHKHNLPQLPTDIQHNGLHLYCLRSPTTAVPKPLPTDRRNALRWTMVQTQMHEVNKVFLMLAWGVAGSGGTGKQLIFLELHHPTSTTTTTTTTLLPHRRFLHLVTGDDSDGNTSLLGPLSASVEEVAETGLQGILLGTHHRKKEGEAEGKKGRSEAYTQDAAKAPGSPVKPSAASPPATTPGDVVCIKGQQSDDDLQFWLVTEAKQTPKTSVACEAVGSILPAHKTLLGKLQSFRSLRIEECGAVLWCRACRSP